jgi:hypothetical protein
MPTVKKNIVFSEDNVSAIQAIAPGEDFAAIVRRLLRHEVECRGLVWGEEVKRGGDRYEDRRAEAAQLEAWNKTRS